MLVPPDTLLVTLLTFGIAFLFLLLLDEELGLLVMDEERDAALFLLEPTLEAAYGFERSLAAETVVFKLTLRTEGANEGAFELPNFEPVSLAIDCGLLADA